MTNYSLDYDLADRVDFHRGLARFNAHRLAPQTESRDGLALQKELEQEHAWRLSEAKFLADECAKAAARAAEAPTTVHGFVEWFEALEENGPGQKHALFPWLAEEAPREAMLWFLSQEIGGEAGFEDLVALTQVRFPTQAKLEMARNYWDEMGRGTAGGMHGPMLETLARELDIDARSALNWQVLALGNLMVGLATNRRYAYHSVGALGVIELTAPWRAAHVNAGLKRLGVGGEARRYFALHSTLDVKHSAAWNREVLSSLVSRDAKTVRALAEGALMRLEAGRRCFEVFTRKLRAPAALSPWRSSSEPPRDAAQFWQ